MRNGRISVQTFRLQQSKKKEIQNSTKQKAALQKRRRLLKGGEKKPLHVIKQHVKRNEAGPTQELQVLPGYFLAVLMMK